MPREPLLPEPPRGAKIPGATRVRCLPRLPPVLGETPLRQISNVPRPDAAAPRAAAAGEVQEGYPQPGPGADADGRGDEGVGALAHAKLSMPREERVDRG